VYSTIQRPHPRQHQQRKKRNRNRNVIQPHPTGDTDAGNDPDGRGGGHPGDQDECRRTHTNQDIRPQTGGLTVKLPFDPDQSAQNHRYNNRQKRRQINSLKYAFHS
jgi:hypothetical protein